MPTKAELLEEYCKIHDELNKLRDKVELLKQETKIKLSFSKSSKDRDKILEYYKKQLNNIKNDVKLKEFYKSLKSKQDQIKIILVNDNKNYNLFNLQPKTHKYIYFNNKNRDKKKIKNLSNNIDTLLNKYKKYSTENSLSTNYDKYVEYNYKNK